jgi:hypothetical protein
MLVLSSKRDNVKNDSYFLLLANYVFDGFAFFMLINLLITVFVFGADANSLLIVVFSSYIPSIAILIGLLSTPLVYYSVPKLHKIVYTDTFTRLPRIFLLKLV